ncbi:MFS transporter [Catenulispora subtropica]|uniref:Major facilitator superfamily (MFS) profile domain-containing protein n=1 Tax=Catenulispora subtropica TaxID=450798 RepID=A0ABP5EAY8_9ACTN
MTALLRERPRPERVRNLPSAWRLAVVTVCFGAFMGQLDASITTLAYPALRTEFRASLAAVSWVSLSYLLTLTLLLVPVGRLSDALGRKLFYVYGFGVFTAASAACALAPSLKTLIAFRVVQALGAAMLQANSIALISNSAPRAKLRSALGVQAAAQALGLGLGPAVGGLLVDTLGWRWVFGVNVPVGLVALAGGVFLLPRTRERNPGFRPDLAPLKQHEVRWGLLGAAGGYLVLFGPLVLVPVIMAARGSSALASGLVLTTLPVGFALGASFLKCRAAAGLGLATAALAALLALPFEPLVLVPLLGLLGLGLGAYAPANNAQVMASVPQKASGVVSGLLNTARSLGTSGGVYLVTSAIAVAAHDDRLGARYAFAGLLAICVLTVAAAVRPRTHPVQDELVHQPPPPLGPEVGPLVRGDDQQSVADLGQLPREQRQPGGVREVQREAAHSQ